MSLGSAQPLNRYEYQVPSYGVKGGLLARKADNFTAICEPTVCCCVITSIRFIALCCYYCMVLLHRLCLHYRRTTATGCKPNCSK
jgi:hypothetical protein